MRGIQLQVVDGDCGYLVDSKEECAERTVELLTERLKGREMGKRRRQRP